MFKEELWKEQRQLSIVDGPGSVKLLRKSFKDRSEVASELRFLSLLSERDPSCVPAVFAHGKNHIDLEYVEGMRIYNILETLKGIEPEADSICDARRSLLDRCVMLSERTQRTFAECGLTWEKKNYPLQRKLITILGLFDHCLELNLETEYLELEIKQAEEYLSGVSCAIPFRDASPKNLILDWPDIWRGRTTPKVQMELLRDAADQLERTDSSPLSEARIVNIDFSSCSELTVPEDDPVRLLVHEASWFGRFPTARQLLWLDIDPDPARLAIGIAVRMYRLGGRRLAYRLVHRNGYRARYGDESIGFYF